MSQFFLQVLQSCTITHNILFDVPLEFVDSRDAALEQRVQNDFLMLSSAAVNYITAYAAHLRRHLLGILFAQERDRAADVQQVVSCNTGEHVKSHLRCS